jgi:hypothetical protein
VFYILSKDLNNMADSPVAGIPVDDLAPLTGGSPAQVVPPPAPIAPTTPAPSTIDWSKIDPKTIPAEVIKQTQAFGEVLTESVERRQQIKALKEQVAGVGEPKPDPKAPAKTDDTPEWAKALVARLDQVETLATTNGRKALIDEALKAHNLPAGSERWITAIDASGITAQAAELSKTFLTPQAGGASGSGSTMTQVDKIRATIEARIRQTNGPIDPVEGSFFNPSIQNRTP